MTPLPACLNVAFKALASWPQPTSTLITWQFSQDPTHQICLPVWEKLGKVHQGGKPRLGGELTLYSGVRSAWGLQGWRPFAGTRTQVTGTPVSARKDAFTARSILVWLGSLGRGAMRGVLYKASLHVDVRGPSQGWGEAPVLAHPAPPSPSQSTAPSPGPTPPQPQLCCLPQALTDVLGHQHLPGPAPV